MFAEIVFPLPFRNVFTYSVPKEFESLIKVGVRTVVPFGKRTLTGFIINISSASKVEEKIKPLLDILDDQPIFTKKDLEFYAWLSEYYLCSLGEALRLAIPYGLEIESKRRIIADKDVCNEILFKEKNKESVKASALKILIEKTDISFSALQRMVKKKNIYSLLRSLEKAGAVTILTELTDAKVGIKTANFVKLNKSLSEIYEYIPEIESKSPKQVKVLLELINKKDKTIRLAELLKKSGASKPSIDSLASKGLVKIFEEEVNRRYLEEYKETLVKFNLTEKQDEVLKQITSSVLQNEFKTFLLHGVTGSGKTQVYIELVKKVLEINKTALILVPEISLTPQITSRLYNNFGELVTVLHSRMSLGERYDSWRRILSRKYKVVVGARSALFAPLENIGLIVVDEEHDSSYKQFDTMPRYNARDCAIVLGKINNCPVLLGSATPSVESMYNAVTEKFKLLELPERIDDAKLPKITLVNVILEKKQKRMENIFSKLLLEKINLRLQKKEGIIILQNRRGFSTQIYCEDCAEVETCINCSVPLVYHINQNILTCHYCGFTKEVPHACNNCGSLSLKYFGTGTERVEDEIEYYFPKAIVKRIDSDSISKKGSLSKILNSFAQGEIDILVGTQIVSKGLDFSRVTLVGVISAETSLWLPDFRADERTFQLLTQVSGRAGRSKVEGEVIIQTQNENHFALQKVLQNDYQGFFRKEIKDREMRGYPPFVRLCLIEVKDMDEARAKGAVKDFYNLLIQYKKWLKVSQPTTALIARLKGNYRYQILVKSPRDTDTGGAILRKAILNSFIEYNRTSRYRDIRPVFDIDPQSVV